MQCNIKNFISMKEANQNFSRVGRLVDENGMIVVLKNNAIRYVIMSYDQFENTDSIDFSMKKSVE